MEIMCFCNSIYIWWLSYAKDFAGTSAGAQTSCSVIKPRADIEETVAPRQLSAS